jgi:hypothetical protein
VSPGFALHLGRSVAARRRGRSQIVDRSDDQMWGYLERLRGFVRSSISISFGVSRSKCPASMDEITVRLRLGSISRPRGAISQKHLRFPLRRKEKIAIGDV